MDLVTNRGGIPLAIEAAAGLAGGLAVAIPLAFLAPRLIQPRPGSFDDVVGAIGALFFGYLIGAVLGVVLAGIRLNRPGRWWAALAGGCLAAALTVGLAALTSSGYPQLAWIFYLAATPLLAAGAFTWSERGHDRTA